MPIEQLSTYNNLSEYDINDKNNNNNDYNFLMCESPSGLSYKFPQETSINQTLIQGLSYEAPFTLNKEGNFQGLSIELPPGLYCDTPIINDENQKLTQGLFYLPKGLCCDSPQELYHKSPRKSSNDLTIYCNENQNIKQEIYCNSLAKNDTGQYRFNNSPSNSKRISSPTINICTFLSPTNNYKKILPVNTNCKKILSDNNNNRKKISPINNHNTCNNNHNTCNNNHNNHNTYNNFNFTNTCNNPYSFTNTYNNSFLFNSTCWNIPLSNSNYGKLESNNKCEILKSSNNVSSKLQLTNNDDCKELISNISDDGYSKNYFSPTNVLIKTNFSHNYYWERINSLNNPNISEDELLLQIQYCDVSELLEGLKIITISKIKSAIVNNKYKNFTAIALNNIFLIKLLHKLDLLYIVDINLDTLGKCTSMQTFCYLHIHNLLENNKQTFNNLLRSE